MWKNIVLINLRSKLRWKDRLLVRLAKLKSCSLGLKESPLSDFVFFPLCFQVDGNLGSVGITSRVQPFTINFIKCSDTQSHAERFKAMQKQFNCKEREETTLLKLPSVLFVIVSFAFQIIIVWWLVYYFWSLLKRRKQSDNISNASACLFLQLSALSQQRWHIPALFRLIVVGLRWKCHRSTRQHEYIMPDSSVIVNQTDMSRQTRFLDSRAWKTSPTTVQ